MPEFTLPLRPVSTNRWLVRKDAKTDLRGVAAADAQSDQTMRTLRSTRSLSHLNFAGIDLARDSEPATSHPQLGTRSTGTITKRTLKRRTTRAQFKTISEVLSTKDEQDYDLMAEQAAPEGDLAFLENNIKDNAAMKEIVYSRRSTKLKFRQSIPLLRKQAEEQMTEETHNKLTPTDLPINKYVVLSARSYDSMRVSTTESLTLLVNDSPILAALSAKLQVEHSTLTESVLLRSQEPRQWIFRSRPDTEDRDESGFRVPEYSRMCNGGDAERVYGPNAEQVYGEFFDFLTRKAEAKAARAIQVAKERLSHVERMRKEGAENTAEGIERESPDVQTPNAVNVFGDVVILF